jgi:membrane fusion protein (multidrug efflux system)
MRVVTQLAVIAIVAGTGAAGWYFKDALWPGQAARASATPQAQARAIPVNAKSVRMGSVDETVEAVGTALANESITVTSRIAGIVKAVRFSDGQIVKAGTVLIELDDRETQADLEAAKAARDQALLAYDRARALAVSGNAPQSRVDDLQAVARATEARVKVVDAKLAELRIPAPFSGKLGIRRVSVGSLISPGTVITTLDDVDVIKLRFMVPETVLSTLKPGVVVEAESSAFPGRTFQGAVTIIDSRIDPATRAVETRADIPNADGTLKPGMFLTIRLAVQRRDNALIVPEEAVFPEGVRQFVYVVHDGRSVKTEVKLGSRLRGEVEVLEGLKSGVQVVTGGVQKIRDGSPVRTVVGAGS